MCFYSVPNSPTRGMLDATSDLGNTTTTTTTTTATTPETYEDANVHLDDFEFETSRRFDADHFVEDGNDGSDSETSQKSEVAMDDQQEERRKFQRKRHESLPAMAFADDFFSDGKVMPLNPPPCQKYSNANANNITSDNKVGKNSSSPTSNSPSPSPSNPRREKRGNHRRALSMLPLRACTQWDPDEFMDHEHERYRPNNHLKLNGSAAPIWMGTQKEGLCRPFDLELAKDEYLLRSQLEKLLIKN
ncbi:hypothetical protein GH714_042282 [Hevea brasiliensis]|uniref:Uncharacterized protein n=1 Tax=Hevea brasiliensis TaxID=3981 RepID=A0A6A6KSG2_HEVBR|nr:hypothetical protein GH714_042282 [Hevea brasiliensis]